MPILLGQNVQAPTKYQAGILTAIPRWDMREDFGVMEMPFRGFDYWSAYELSWLDMKGKPVVAVADIIIPFDSPNMIESKSLKLYLNSLNQHGCSSARAVQALIEEDLSDCAKKPVQVMLHDIDSPKLKRGRLLGRCLDDLDVELTDYEYNPSLLCDSTNAMKSVSEEVYTHLFRSNCPVTNQPDWASIAIAYQGEKINEEKLLAYLVSFRNHQGFHENVIEMIYMDIVNYCKPAKLTVSGHFTRRGGLDINPVRTNLATMGERNTLLYRQ